MTKKYRAVHVILALAMMFALIGVSVIGTLAFKPLYYHDIKSLHIVENSGYEEAEIRENYNALIDYNLSMKKGMLEFPTLPQSDNAQYHFYEVKNLFDDFKYLALGGLILSVILIIYCKKKDLGILYLKYTAIFSIVIPAVLGALIAMNWDWFFVTFHHIAFDNDFWIFSASTDPIILMLPDAFFMHCAIMILALVIAGSIICGLIYYRKAGGRKNA